MISPQPNDFGDRKSAPWPSSGFAGEASITGWRRWIFATAGIVLMLLLVQFLTGLLLAFYYVPSVDHAHTTVSFIEKALPAGSWIRALHHHGSQWLPLFLFLHIAELFWRKAYRTQVNHWLAAVVLLALVMAGGATGYSLPWDVRAFFSTRVAEGIVNGLPLVGSGAREWLLGSSEISTLTLSRFFALHVLVTPFLILLVLILLMLTLLMLARQLLVSRTNHRSASPDDHFENNADTRGSQTDSPAEVIAAKEPSRSRGLARNQLTRNVLVASVVFLLLGLYAHRFPAPLGPSATNASADYLPRPGAQFVWLYQTLKYVPGALGSLVGVVLPGLVVLTLAALPWLDRTPLRRITNHPRRNIGAAILSLVMLFVSDDDSSLICERPPRSAHSATTGTAGGGGSGLSPTTFRSHAVA